MGDFLDVLAAEARKTIARGYYDVGYDAQHPTLSLRRAIVGCSMNPVISEVKKASPSRGLIRPGIDAAEAAMAMEAGGAAGISVLTEPEQFKGSLHSIRRARESVDIPILMKDIVLDPDQVDAASKMGANAVLLILMKDIILDPDQVDAASKMGANAVLLIKALFDRGLCSCDIDTMIEHAHGLGLEVLLETHTGEEFRGALGSGADLIGINNRDLKTFEVDLGVTVRILGENDPGDGVIVSESGIRTPEDIRRLREAGTGAFLIGSAIMESEDVESAVRRFATA
jgi:indole-3-glycerol phosphate synthase